MDVSKLRPTRLSDTSRTLAAEASPGTPLAWAAALMGAPFDPSLPLPPHYDQVSRDEVHFLHASAPLDDSAKAEVDRLHRLGVSDEVLALRFGRTPSGIRRVTKEQRARRLVQSPIEFMPNPSFDDPKSEPEFLGPMPQAPRVRQSRAKPAPDGLPPYLASLYDDPLLTREQEQHLFRKMNYLKHRAWKIQQSVDPGRAKTADLERAEAFLEEALAVKNQIIRCNLRLVVSIAKQHMNPTRDFFELVSDGNMSLIRAVEKFDYARGNKFSTYASWAIMKNFSRSIPEEKVRRDRFVTGHEELFEAATDTRGDEHLYENSVKRMQETIKGMLGRLDDRERRIIISRFGLGGASEQTLEQLGRELGITKERVRQLESRAQGKLRDYAAKEQLDFALI
jgi:RNA polymerase primary sigma factor